MLRFLSAEVLYGLLLVTTFASVGLLGLWAATSRSPSTAAAATQA